jgi:hypothetical protein
VVPWVRLEIGFYSVFLLPREEMSLWYRHFLGRRSVSLANYHLFRAYGPSAVRPSCTSKFTSFSAEIEKLTLKFK